MTFEEGLKLETIASKLRIARRVEASAFELKSRAYDLHEKARRAAEVATTAYYEMCEQLIK